MVTITDRSLRSNVFETVYDNLKAYATSSSYSTASQPLVVASYVDDYDFSAPMIVISNVNVSNDNNSFGQSKSDKSLIITIEIFTKKNKNIDLLSDDINYFMNSVISGISLIGSDESNDVIDINKNKIRYKNITYTYLRR